MFFPDDDSVLIPPKNHRALNVCMIWEKTKLLHTAKKCDRQKLTVTLKVFFIKAFFTALVWHSSSARQAGKNGSFLELTLASGKHTMWSVRRQYGTCAQSKESETFFLPLFKGTKTMNSFKSNVTHCDDTMLSDKP